MLTASAETIASLLAAQRPGRAALVNAASGDALTYGELLEAVDGFADQLMAAGIRRGDCVAFVLPDGPAAIEALLATTVLGAAAAPLNPGYTASELSFYFSDLRPRALLLSPGSGHDARAVVSSEVAVFDVTVERGRVRLAADRPARSVVREEPQPDDVALLLHTSGTTSRPKQVALLHRNLVASARAMAAHYQLGATDVSYCAMPLFHVHGIVGSALAQLAAGGRLVVPDRFAPGRFWPHVEEHSVTWFSAGPTLHRMILDRHTGNRAPQSLRFTRSCSSALSPDLLERAEEIYQVPMLEAYGMTEASHQIASNPLPPAPRVPNTVGRPAGAEIRIAISAGDEMGGLGAGEVLIRGPGVTPGYVNNQEATSAAFIDGWFRTGDLGIFDDGYLRLRGRLKEIIIRGGENVSPLEIDEVLSTHAAVGEAVSFGVPNEKYGEVVAAAVTLVGETDERELVAYCRERLAAFKVPERIFVLEQLPRTPTGKVQRNQVAALVAEDPT